MWRAAPAILASLLVACTYSPVPLRTGGDDVSGDQDGTGDFEPAVTLWSDRMCVAWSEVGRPGVEVLMRCTDF